MVRQAMMESGDKRAGGESVLAKLSELMFIEVVRRHLEALPPEQMRQLRQQIRDAARRYLSRTDYARISFQPKP